MAKPHGFTVDTMPAANEATRIVVTSTNPATWILPRPSGGSGRRRRTTGVAKPTNLRNHLALTTNLDTRTSDDLPNLHDAPLVLRQPPSSGLRPATPPVSNGGRPIVDLPPPWRGKWPPKAVEGEGSPSGQHQLA